MTSMRPVLAATNWPTNAHMIADCRRLKYVNTDDFTLDPTYGRGTWWKFWRPTNFVAHDIIVDAVDFRHLPEGDSTFDVVAFDPPYVSVGGRTTTKIQEFYDRFGLTDAPTTPALVQKLINDGLTEAHRVLKKKGRALVKCQSYVSSGKLWLGPHYTTAHALELGFEVVDILQHTRKAAGPQPARATQVHARQNYSTLLVLRK
jgi:tRNA G10  N-methylase Trm11